MIRSNKNEEQFCILNFNANILRDRANNSYLSYKSINQNSMENSYNSLPIFDWEEEKKRSNNSIDEDINENLYILHPKDKPSKSSIKFESKKFLKQKRGKKRKQQEINKGYIKIHDKYRIDNVLRKIQVHYITFIVSFINDILENLGISQRFLYLNYSIKKNVKIEYINSLKNKDVGKILCNKISDKYKKDQNINFENYNKVKDNEIMKKFFSINYSLLFKNIYYNSIKSIDLKEYGFNISLSDNVKMFEDLIKDIEKKDISGEYKENIIKCARKYFFPLKFKIKDSTRRYSKFKIK